MPLTSTSKSRAKLAQDAAARGFTVTRELRGPGLPGLLFRAGENVVASEVIDATGSSTPFLAGGLIGKYANDSSIPRMLASSFVAIPLPREVPHIVLFGRGIGMLKLAGVGLGGSQRFSLEGDFDRSFTLYCPEGYERDALRIFAPDLMQLLVDTTQGCDVELVDNWMFVYSRPGRYRDSSALDGLVAVTERVQSKLHRQTATYRDERGETSGTAGLAASARTVSPDEHAARVGRVTAKGARLSTKKTPLQRLVTAGSTVLLLGAVIALLIFQPF